MLILEDPRFASFANHLQFLARHRGQARIDATAWHLRGDCSALSCWTPWQDDAELPAEPVAVRLAPWLGAHWPARLRAAGYRPAERLSYLSWTTPPIVDSKTESDPAIHVVTDGVAAASFAAVQQAGFATGEATMDAWWAAHFRRAAQANVGDDAQRFYLAFSAGQAVSCTLLLCVSEVAGIYAVATRPETRRQGWAKRLLIRAARDARREFGLERIILQAIADSPALAYYHRLGFATDYSLDVWRRA